MAKTKVRKYTRRVKGKKVRVSKHSRKIKGRKIKKKAFTSGEAQKVFQNLRGIGDEESPLDIDAGDRVDDILEEAGVRVKKKGLFGPTRRIKPSSVTEEEKDFLRDTFDLEPEEIELSEAEDAILDLRESKEKKEPEKLITKDLFSPIEVEFEQTESGLAQAKSSKRLKK